jgi:hypothetical protein
MANAENVTSVHASSELSETIIQKDVKRKWTSYIWDTFDKSPEERRLLFKLDAALLSFASLGTLYLKTNRNFVTVKIH